MRPVPRLETPRLTLREWLAGDAAPHAAMCADPEVMRYMSGVLDEAESWRRMALHAGHWALRGYGNWVLERREDGAFVGRAGFWNPEGWPGLEIGWMLARPAWGNGYATEAARAALAWGWKTLECERVIALIKPDNRASLAVAERLGMQPLRRDTLGGAVVEILALDRPWHC